MGIEADRSDTSREEAIKAGARALHRRNCPDADEMDGAENPNHVDEARAILDAALPHILRPVHRIISEHAAAHEHAYRSSDRRGIPRPEVADGYRQGLLHALDIIDAYARTDTNRDADTGPTDTFPGSDPNIITDRLRGFGA